MFARRIWRTAKICQTIYHTRSHLTSTKNRRRFTRACVFVTLYVFSLQAPYIIIDSSLPYCWQKRKLFIRQIKIFFYSSLAHVARKVLMREKLHFAESVALRKSTHFESRLVKSRLKLVVSIA